LRALGYPLLGYVDWKTLLKEIIEDLGLDPMKNTTRHLGSVSLQQSSGSKAQLTQTIFNHFAPAKVPTESHRILAAYQFRRIGLQTTTSYWKGRLRSKESP